MYSCKIGCWVKMPFRPFEGAQEFVCIDRLRLCSKNAKRPISKSLLGIGIVVRAIRHWMMVRIHIFRLGKNNMICLNSRHPLLRMPKPDEELPRTRTMTIGTVRRAAERLRPEQRLPLLASTTSAVPDAIATRTQAR